VKTYKLLALLAAFLLTSAESIALDHLFTHAPGRTVAAEQPIAPRRGWCCSGARLSRPRRPHRM